jgi:hypothetical protein
MAVASAFPRPPAVSPLPGPPPLHTPRLWYLQSSGRGRLLGEPRFLYAHRPFAVLARGSSLQKALRDYQASLRLPPGPLDSRYGSPAGQEREAQRDKTNSSGPHPRPRVLPDSLPLGIKHGGRNPGVGTRRWEEAPGHAATGDASHLRFIDPRSVVEVDLPE